MKNRNIPYYAAALLMAAGLSTSMVSCVDTDEPESIALLRQAKANEVNAKASLINAQASQVLSNIDLEKATRAITDQGLVLENKKAEIENAKNELTNAKTKLENALKAAKDSIELDSLKAQKLWKEKIAVANAEAQYEAANAALEKAKTKALVDIEGAKNDLLKKQKEIAVELAKINKWGLKDELKDAAQALADSTADEAKKLKALQNAVKNFLTNREDIEDELDDANEIVETLKANKADFEAAIAQNDLADWLKKYWELQDIIDKNEPTQHNLEYQIEQKNDELNAVYDEAWKTNLSELAITQYDEKIEIGSEELESLLDVDATSNLKIEDGKLQYKKDEITLTYAYKDESSTPDSLIAKDELKDDYKILSGQLTTIISDLKQNIEKVDFDANKFGKTATDAAKEALDPKKGTEYKAWEAAKTAYNKADDKTYTGAAYVDLAKACNDFFGYTADPSDPDDEDEYLDFIINTSLPTYDEVVKLFGGDTDEADNFYYYCGSVFADANYVLATNAELNKYELSLEAAQKLKKTLDECDFGDAELEEAEAADEALWTEDAQKIKDEIDALQDQLDKLTPTVQNAQDLQKTILGFAIKANLAFMNDNGTPEDDDDYVDFADYTFDGGTADPDVTDKKFKEAYDFTVKTYQEDIEVAEEYAAALKELLDDFDKKGKEGNDIDFENGCDDIEDFFTTMTSKKWSDMIKTVTDAQEEYDDAKNATKKAQDAYDLLKSVYLVEQKN